MTMPILTLPNGQTVNSVVVLTHCKNALNDLLNSNGYKNARLANKKDSVFYTTYAGKCETELRAAITALGG